MKRWSYEILGALLLLLGGLWLGACGSTSMTPNGPEQTAREPNCEFRMFTTLPSGYTEIAAIDVKPGGYGHNVHTDIADFKEAIQPSVCQAGGDAAIAYANGYGMYIKATVLKRVEGGSEAPTAEASSGAAPAASGGCQFDTQCKGDRVCIKGECVEPAAATAAPAAPTAPAAPPAAAP